MDSLVNNQNTLEHWGTFYLGEKKIFFLKFTLHSFIGKEWKVEFKGLFGIRLFWWNWKLFAKSTVDKGKS